MPSRWVQREEQMKIAQIAPLIESCPPLGYGGTERVVSYLTEDLVAAGHDVTLFASGDSKTHARLLAPIEQALRLKGSEFEAFAYHSIMLHRILERMDEFDVLHFHTDFLHFPSFERVANKTVTTLHGRQDYGIMADVLHEFAAMPLVSISDAQRIPVRDANWVRTIHHGLPPDLYEFGTGKGGYLAFIGRISPEKRPDRAIEIAHGARLKLKMAAKIDKADRVYYDTKIAALMKAPHVEFIGEIGDAAKSEFYGNALGLVFPIDWPEPFGLVMIEAMATGTPTIAFRHGSVGEIVEDGVTGFIVDTVDEAIAAVPKLKLLDRRKIRKRFEERFSIRRVTDAYVELYRTQTGNGER